MRVSVVILTIVGLFLGCVQKNVLTTENGVITGSVRPAGANALIYLEGTADSTVSGEDGYFTFTDVPHGDYTLIVEAEGYSHRERHHVIVGQAQITALGVFELTTLPYPIFYVLPRDAELNVSAGEDIYLFSDERLDLTTLQSFAHFEPTIAGHWVERESYSPSFSYVFHSDSGLELASTYQLIVPVDVQTKAGQSLDHEISTQFTTAPLSVVLNIAGSRFVRVYELNAVLISNAFIDVDSLNKAFTIEPSLDARWFVDPNPQSSRVPRLVIPVGVTAQPETWYSIVISDRVALSDSLKLPRPYVALFKTEGFGVASIDPSFNRYMLRDDTVLITLNLPADTASIENAMSVIPRGGAAVPISIAWSADLTTMRITPPGGWTGRTTYTVTISPGARSAEGATLASEYISYFYAL